MADLGRYRGEGSIAVLYMKKQENVVLCVLDTRVWQEAHPLNLSIDLFDNHLKATSKLIIFDDVMSACAWY